MNTDIAEGLVLSLGSCSLSLHHLGSSALHVTVFFKDFFTDREKSHNLWVWEPER